MEFLLSEKQNYNLTACELVLSIQKEGGNVSYTWKHLLFHVCILVLLVLLTVIAFPLLLSS